MPMQDHGPGSLIRHRHALLLGLLLLAALAIRCDGITGLPLAFKPTRQYRSAIIARDCYYRSGAPAATWQQRIAALNRQRAGILEPQIMELLACWGYRLAGAEYLWIPLSLSATFWVLGGLFLYLAARRLVSADGALAAVAFFLFLPFGITASRSFQPDPLMIMLLCGSLLVILRYDDEPSGARVAVAGAVSGLAILVKPVCLFVILAAFLSLSIRRRGVRQCATDRHVIAFVGISLGVGAAFSFYAIFVARLALRHQAGISFLPRLWLRPSYWRGWLHCIRVVVGAPALLLALLGTALLRGRQRWFLLGLLGGYVAFGLAFTYHVHTHTYYQLQLVPIVALGLGAVVDAVRRQQSRLGGPWPSRLAALAVLGLALGPAVRGYSPPTTDPGFIAVARQIGAAVGHSANTIFLAEYYGKPLIYHGELAGVSWPKSADFRAQRLRGESPLTAAEQLAAFRRSSPEYFIVSDLPALDAQADLKRLLDSRFPVVAKTDRYVIFDLRRSRP